MIGCGEGSWPPLFSGLLDHVKMNYVGWHVPGHKQGRGAWPLWRDFLGNHVFSLDLTELPGLDNLHSPSGIIQAAEQAAAAYFGAEETFFLVNGTTAGILAVLLATCKAGDFVILPRICHQAVINGLIICGASPVYLPVYFHSEWGLPGLIRNTELDKTIKSLIKQAQAIVLLHPNYYGLTGDLAAQIKVAHRGGSIVLVDEAHGAHFCTSSHFPPPALQLGADYVAQGAHKVLGAFTQAALLHCQGSRFAADKIRQALRIVQTSSPSYLLMASLDVARYQCQQTAKNWEQAAEKGLELRRKISQIPGLFAPAEELKDVPGVIAFDPTRLIVNVSGLGITGFTAADWLQRERQILVEMADMHNLVFIICPDDLCLAPALLEALEAMAASFSTGTEKDLKADPDMLTLPVPRQLMTPRAAFFADHCTIPLFKARGKIAAEVIAPYPPGVPVIYPGEEISAEALDYLAAWQEAGGDLARTDNRKNKDSCRELRFWKGGLVV